MHCIGGSEKNAEDESGREPEAEILMAKKRGNPNWGKPEVHSGPITPTSFEEVVKKLRLAPADYGTSLQLREWAQKNKDQKYVPDDLLKLWGFEVKGDL